jgi:GTP-binding protein
MQREASGDPLVIRKLEFLGGQTATGGFHPSGELPEVAFAGRSNSGKSSLLNRLVRRKKLARVSRTPGRTREINFFSVNDSFVLADLPGYGFARVAATARESWRVLIDNYLRRSGALRGVVILLDVRRDPSDDDIRMFELLAELELPTLAAITKVDKLSRARAVERVRAIRDTLGLEDDQVVPFSAVSGEGRDELAAAMVALVSQPPRDK